jgi:hypothetical protein
MPRNLTDSECKDIIRKLGKRLNVEPRLITTRLMSEDDKQDMREGNLPVKSLEVHIKVWMDNGMPDYAHGKTIPLKHEAKEV